MNLSTFSDVAKLATRRLSAFRIMGAVAVLALGLCACGKPPETRPAIASLADLDRSGMTVGVVQGTAAMNAAETRFPHALIRYFSTIPDGQLAVRSGQVDAFAYDRQTMEFVVAHNPDLVLLPEAIGTNHIVIGLTPGRPELLPDLNRFIQQYIVDGTRKDMETRWFRSTTPPTVPDFPAPVAPALRLNIGTEALNEPMNYIGPGGILTGYDIELAHRLGLFLNAEIVYHQLSFDALIPALQSGKLDLLISDLNATPERREKMLMSDAYLSAPIAVMIRADRFVAPAANGIRSLADLAGKTAASMTGSAFQDLTDPLQPDIHHVFFNDNFSSVEALKVGKVDAVLLDKPMAQLFAARFPEDVHLACVYAEDTYGFAFRKGDPLAERASEVIHALKASGEMDELVAKWCGSAASAKRLSDWPRKPGDATASAGVLRYASDMTQEPMCYADADGRPVGFEVDVMRRIAAELGMGFEFVPLNFGSLIEALITGRADAVGGAMSITDARKERVDFAETHYIGGLCILARIVGGGGATDAAVSPAASPLTNISQLDGQRIGVVAGSTLDQVVQSTFPRAQAVYFNSFADLPQALEAGKLDAFLMEDPQVPLMLRQRPALVALPQKISSDCYAFAFPKSSQALCDAFSHEIRSMKKDGTLDALAQAWLYDGDVPTLAPLPPANKGVLRVGTIPELEPFTFVRDGLVTGYDIEIARQVAGRLGYNIEVKSMDYASLIEAINAGKIDFAASLLTVTEERQAMMLFCEPDYQGGLRVIVRKSSAEGASDIAPASRTTFWQNLRASFDRTFVRESRWKLIRDGLGVTLLITILSGALGTLLAFPVCFLRRARNPLARALGKGYVSLMQGTPMLVLLMIFYYIFFAKCDINAVWVAVIGFGLNFAAYAGEMLRTGIDAVPKGQREAALALGFSSARTFLKIILPQALRQVLPVYRGEFINMLKTTSVVGYIAIQDLTKMSDIIRSRTYEAFFPLLVTALIYFLVAWVLALGLSAIERRLDPHARRQKLARNKEMQ